jgi:predicted dehydrogenase
MLSSNRWGILGKASMARRLTKSLNSLKQKVLYVATRKKYLHKNKKFCTYQQLLSKKDIDHIYIPLPNSLHFLWSKKFLLQSKNVLVEKPAVLSSKHLHELLKIAKKKNVLFKEALMYRHNFETIKFLKILKKLLKKNKIEKIECEFSKKINFSKKNIRFSKKLEGGCLNDLGYYGISMINAILPSAKLKKITFIEKELKKKIFTKVHFKLSMQNKIVAEIKSSFNNNNNYVKIYFNNKSILYKNCFTYNENKVIEISTKKNLTKIRLPTSQDRYIDQINNYNNNKIYSIEEMKKNIDFLEKINNSIIHSK